MRQHAFGVFALLVAAQVASAGQRAENYEVSALPANRAIVVDGSLKEWDLSSSTFACPNLHYRMEGLWTVEEGLKKHAFCAAISAAHDKEHLYLAVRVKDPTPLNNSIDPSVSPGDGWKGDCIQFRLQVPKDNGQIAWLDCWQYAGTKTPAATLTWRGPGRNGQTNAIEAGVKSAYVENREGDGYTLELALPWALVTPEPSAMTPSNALGVGVEISDSGDESHPEGRITDLLACPGTPTTGFYKSPQNWGRLVLRADAGTPTPVYNTVDSMHLTNNRAAAYSTMDERQPLYSVPKHLQTRWASPENWTGEKGKAAQASNGRKGSPNFSLPAGASRVLAEISGKSGTVSRIWATLSERTVEVMRGLRIDIYWDGAKTPAVSAPWGDFFGQGLGQCIQFDSALFSNPEGRSFNCSVPMPFRTGMKIVVSNESRTTIRGFFYDINYTLGDRHPDDMCYFHAHWRRENPTRLQRDYEFLPKVSGRGRFLGVNVGVIPDTARYARSWWGEGEFKAFIDGDTAHPTLSGTGTEDYIGTAWGQGLYSHAYQGCHYIDGKRFRYAFYRYHVQDPIYFQKDIRVCMQQIGNAAQTSFKEMLASGTTELTGAPNGAPFSVRAKAEDAGYTMFEREDDWSSCAWFYLDRPENGLPALQPVEERVCEERPATIVAELTLTQLGTNGIAALRLSLCNKGTETLRCAGKLTCRSPGEVDTVDKARIDVEVEPSACIRRDFEFPVEVRMSQFDWVPETRWAQSARLYVNRP